MLTYDLERRGSLARYDYLYRCIKEDILSGRLAAGEKLPSKRALARHLETAVVTVENAYAQLSAEGYLRPEEKRGYFVCPVEVRPDRPPAAETRPRQAAPQRRWLLDMTSGGSGTEGFPFSVWARLMRRVITEEGERLMRSLPHSGALPLRQALARHIYQFRGIAADPEQIVVGAGTEYLYNLLVQLLGRDRVYGVEDPGYSKAGRVYALNGAACVCLPVDGQGVDPAQADRVIYMTTFSRSLAPSVRIAYMVLPRPLLEAYQARLGFYSCTVPAMEQYTLARFLEDGHFDAHVNRMRVFYRARRDAVLQAIEESPLAGRCRVMGENAGLHFLLELDTEVPDEVLARQAEERGLRLAFLSDYQQRAAGDRPHTLVVNYPGTDLEHLAQALDILTEILDQHP